jgi:2-keto-4-pentenoate hydratase/2-oxohepta-3-ene-1,7-dioic acid hydratase in catechol pathway
MREGRTMADGSTVDWGLASVAGADAPVACLDIGGRLLPLERTSVGAVSVRQILADWDRFAAALAQAAAAPGSGDFLPGDTVRLAPLLYPGKILCAGANYYDHIAEMGVPDTSRAAQRLFFFFKPPANAVVGPGPTVRKPIGTHAFDWEVELAAVIGRTARNVGEAEALSHVAAYTVAIDFSARDLNRAPETFYKLDWVAGKAHDTCCPMGPRLVPASAFADPQDIGLRLRVNGQTKQDARTSGMIFSVAEQIAALSRIMTLDPGDVILTGTPAGVGVPKGTFLSVGDTVEAEIDGIGSFAVTIQPEG